VRSPTFTNRVPASIFTGSKPDSSIGATAAVAAIVEVAAEEIDMAHLKYSKVSAVAGNISKPDES
jgi:hypothetical protein